MPRCKYCNQLNKPADSFQDPDIPSNQYCSEDHWQAYRKLKEKKKPVIVCHSKQVDPTPKSKPKDDRIRLTDCIQELWPREPNWKWIGKQIENLKKETGLSYNEMRMTVRYCVEFKGLQVDEEYGLGQFIPRYSQEALDFANEITRIKNTASSIDFEDEFQSVPIGKVKSFRVLNEDVRFDS